MRNRHQNAVEIQQGACNVVAIANALLTAARDAREGGIAPESDPAVQLIVHQLAFLCNTAKIDEDITVYNELLTYCEERVPRREEVSE